MKNIAGCLCLPILLFNGFDQENQKERPNIIFIIADDQSPMPIDAARSSQSHPIYT